MSVAEARSFGAALGLVVDTLFFGAVLFVCAHMRANLESWPDAGAVEVSFALPGIAVVLVGLSWLAHQRRSSLLLPFAGLAVALATLGFFWYRAADAGLTWRFTRYGFMAFGVTALWALHLFGAQVALGIQFLRGRDADKTLLLRRFLLCQTAIGIALVVVVDG